MNSYKGSSYEENLTLKQYLELQEKTEDFCSKIKNIINSFIALSSDK